MRRNIVICCDGTGNAIEGDFSNVLKLFRIALKDEEQIVYYNTGVGTIGLASDWARFCQKAKTVFGLATGYGLDANVLDAYRFVCQTWRPDDRIYIFGFSRGAYTARILAGFIHLIGLLRPENTNLAANALTAYKSTSQKNDFSLARSFRRMCDTRHATIHFVGVWDTVASWIVPRPDRFYLPSLGTLPFTRNNPSVRTFRHAISIDERRRMFRLNEWEAGQIFEPVPFANPPSTEKQDVLEMAFAGVHSDIGSAYPEDESALSKFPLAWLIKQAEAKGLKIKQSLYLHLVDGAPLPDGRHFYTAPNAAGCLHNSLTWPWWLLEVIPKRTKRRETRRWSLLWWWYFPLGERRRLPATVLLHPSVRERQRAREDYNPQNIASLEVWREPNDAAPGTT